MKLYPVSILVVVGLLFLTLSTASAQDLYKEKPRRQRLRNSQGTALPSNTAAQALDDRDALEVLLPLRFDAPYEIRYRRFGQSGRNAFRLSFAFDLDGTVDEVYDAAADKTGTINRNRLLLGLAPGWERHFLVQTSWQNVQVSPYFALTVPISFDFYGTEFENTDGLRYIEGYKAEITNAWINNANSTVIDGNTRSQAEFGLRFHFGADVYIHRRAFVGFECSFGPSLSGQPEVEREIDGQDAVKLAPMQGRFRLNTAVLGGVRFGVRF